MSNTYDSTTDARVNPAYDNELNTDDNIQHGIDDSPTGDAEKGATLGGIGGAVTGAVAGAMAGPLGAVAGAIIGGVAGAVASGAAVGAIDRVDNDDTISGVGTGVTTDLNNGYVTNDTVYNTSTADYNLNNPAYNNETVAGNGVPGIQTGGYDVDGTPDTRGMMEKTADAITGDNLDDKTGKPVADGSWRNDYTEPATVGNGVPGIQTGGYANDGTPDTRGIAEKAADAVTGDVIDDKTGKVVDHR